MIPVVWTIAGSDSGGGAGIQADLKIMHELKVHGCSIITALTAQNTLGVQLSEGVSPEMLKAQLSALAEDLPPAAIKTGMLGTASNISIIADALQKLKETCDFKLICDPVLKSTSGADLLQPEALSLLKKELLPLVDLLTPNLPEAAQLIGQDLPVEEMASMLIKSGVKSVLIKGGHSQGNTCSDYWTDGEDYVWFKSPRIDTTSTHGTGCVLSAAIASFISLGHPMQTAIQKAKELLTEKLCNAPRLGAGHGPFV